MGYDISLVNPATSDVIELDQPLQLQGGTMSLEGSREASLNVTYNYSSIFGKVMGEGGIRTIYGMKALDSVVLLESAMSQLNNNLDADYWKATEGNVRAALASLVKLAKALPDAQWAGD
jgi:hypothetical protein